MLVNEACYSGTWAPIALDVGDNRDVIVEAAAPIGEKSFTFRSASGKYRCSLFACAYIEELETHPEGKIVHHYSRIRDEMQHVAPNQSTNSPTFLPSSRSLWSCNIDHFLLTPNIARAIMDVASDENRHEELLKTKTTARATWARLRRGAQSGENQALAESSDRSDVSIAYIEDYLEELGTEADSLQASGLASICKFVLEGKVGNEMKDKCVKTIIWQETQMVLAKGVINALVDNGCIARPVDFLTANKLDIDLSFLGFLRENFTTIKQFDGMMSAPESEGCIPVFYPAPAMWVLKVLAYNRNIAPRSFDLDKAMQAVRDYFERSPALLN